MEKPIDRYQWEMDKKFRCVYKRVHFIKPIAFLFLNLGLVAESQLAFLPQYHTVSNFYLEVQPEVLIKVKVLT